MAGLGLLRVWLLLAVVVVVSIVVAVGCIWLGDRALSDSVGQENNSALSPFLTCVALVFGALLGFTVASRGSSSPPRRPTSPTKRQRWPPCTGRPSACPPPNRQRCEPCCAPTRTR